MSAISRHQPLIIFVIDQSGDQSSKSEIKKGILVFELPGILLSNGFDNKDVLNSSCRDDKTLNLRLKFLHSFKKKIKN